jgi:uncharacterized protein (TIGR02266 family)
MNDPHEKRKHPRTELILKINYTSSGDFLADYASNASRGGLFIATNRKFARGELLAFDISFPGLLSPIRCHGEVRWVRTKENSSDNSPAGIGIAFVFRSKEEEENIRQIVDRLSPAAASASLTPAPSDAKRTGESFKVLVAEDNPLVREMLRFGLRKYQRSKDSSLTNLEVVEAENGGKAWDMIQKESIQLAIIDYYMPVMNGAQLVKMIRDNEKLSRMPVIMVSGGGDEAREEAYSAGADLFLDKPVLLGNLLESLKRLLQIKQ